MLVGRGDYRQVRDAENGMVILDELRGLFWYCGRLIALVPYLLLNAD